MFCFHREAIHLLRSLQIAIHPCIHPKWPSKSLEQTERERQQRVTSDLVRNRHDCREIGDLPGPGRETRQVNHAAGDWNDESILIRCQRRILFAPRHLFS